MPATKPRRLLVLGELVPPRLSVPRAGGLLGISRSYSYEVAKRDGWPIDGGRVLSIPFCERYGLPWEQVQDDTETED